ncbi:MAG: nucleoside 2-deoxyribosyltransferase [Halobacteriota archaeon]|nr:nucleoside 2-deoxyribosyltransferase [Halobacteriota archaeon]
MRLLRKVYLAGPLFSLAETEFNKRLCEKIVSLGYKVFLPQEDSNNSHDSDIKNEEIFEKNLVAIDDSDIIVAVLDGADIDSGTAWEIGYASALRKPVFGIKTDFRSLGKEGPVNLMIYYSLKKFCTTVEELMIALGGEGN